MAPGRVLRPIRCRKGPTRSRRRRRTRPATRQRATRSISSSTPWLRRLQRSRGRQMVLVVDTATPTFTGTGDDGDTITVTDGDGNVLCTTTVVDGEWSCTPTDRCRKARTLSPRPRRIRPELDGGRSDRYNGRHGCPCSPRHHRSVDGAVVTDATPTFSGTGDDGDTITVTDGDGTVLCTTTVVDGVGRAHPTDPLPEGVNTRSCPPRRTRPGTPRRAIRST